MLYKIINESSICFVAGIVSSRDEERERLIDTDVPAGVNPQSRNLSCCPGTDSDIQQKYDPVLFCGETN